MQAWAFLLIGDAPPDDVTIAVVCATWHRKHRSTRGIKVEAAESAVRLLSAPLLSPAGGLGRRFGAAAEWLAAVALHALAIPRGSVDVAVEVQGFESILNDLRPRLRFGETTTRQQGRRQPLTSNRQAVCAIVAGK
jgi:hypothetical protein